MCNWSNSIIRSRTLWPTRPPERRVARLTALAVSTVLLIPAGCSKAKIDAAVKKIFSPRLTPQQHMLIAVSDADADTRRESVAEVAASRKIDAEWAIKGFTTIALLDSDTQARCVAIRALARTRDPRAVRTCLEILNWRDQPPQQVRPPDDLCRWDATVALADLSEAGVVPESQRDAVRLALLARLRLDSNRHARIAAARGLAHYPASDTLQGLIDGLRDEDFAVAYRCELSLVALTGETHDCSAYAWEQWLAAHEDDPFARAGQVPPSRRAPYHNRAEKTWYDTRQFFRWLFPGPKD
jgi:hypothetical protein